jgi:arginine decarboxylase
VKVTSVAPPEALLIDEAPAIEAGTLVPAVLTSVQSRSAGETISACIGIGFSAQGHGMIMERSGSGPAEQMENIVRGMLHESLERRGLVPQRLSVRSVSHTVERIGSCVAAVVLWWR